MVITHNHQFKNVVIPMVKVSDHYNIVDIRGSHELKVTDEHPFYVREVYSKDSISEPKWVNCVDLNSSHYIGVPLNRNSITPSISSDIDFWYKIGLYVSTDYTQYNNILCKDTLNLIQTFGHESNKEIPSFLFDTSIDIIKSFLEGFLQNNTNTVSTTSERFAYGIIQLIQKVYNTQSEITKQEQTYTIRFSKERQDTDDYIVEEGFIWTPFKSKVRIINSIKVYNFEVADDNSYSVNNLIVHNCQAWSMAGKQQGDKDERGKLFWVLLDIIKHVLDSNPNAKYIIENVKMKKVFEEYITSHTENALGIVHKTLINSALLSAQNRNRYYWTNFEVSHPEDKGITWGDVRDTGVNTESYYYTEKALQWLGRHSQRKEKVLTVHKPDEKMQMIEASHYKKYSAQRFFGICDLPTDQEAVAAMRGRYIIDGKRQDPESGTAGKTRQYIEFRHDGKTNSITTVSKDNIVVPFTLPNRVPVDMFFFRYITPEECEKLQTVDVGYTAHVSKSQRYKMLGNGFTVDVIVHILSCIDWSKTV